MFVSIPSNTRLSELFIVSLVPHVFSRANGVGGYVAGGLLSSPSWKTLLLLESPQRPSPPIPLLLLPSNASSFGHHLHSSVAPNPRLSFSSPWATHHNALCLLTGWLRREFIPLGFGLARLGLGVCREFEEWWNMVMHGLILHILDRADKPASIMQSNIHLLAHEINQTDSALICKPNVCAGWPRCQ